MGGGDIIQLFEINGVARDVHCVRGVVRCVQWSVYSEMCTV